jgi:uncharacterized membrane protein
MIPVGIPRWFAFLCLLLGSAYALFMGPLRGPDEAGHMYRAYLVSRGICTGIPAIGAPVDYNRDLDRLYPWIQLPGGTTGTDMIRMIDPAHGRTHGVVALYYAVNLYSCVPYLATGAAFRTGSLFGASPVSQMYLGRIANLLAYLVLVLAAMRILPEFQLPIALLGLMPMSLHQAGSLSADALTIGVSFLLTAWLIRLAIATPDRHLARRDYLLLAAAMIVAGLCKSSAGLVFLLLLVPASRFPGRRHRWLAIAGFVALAYGTSVIWQLINQPNGEIYTTLKTANHVYADRNFAALIHRPIWFLGYVRDTIAWKTGHYLSQFVGVFGWLIIKLPRWMVGGYLVLLALASAASARISPISLHRRLLLVAIFLVNIGIVGVAFWITETPTPIDDLYVLPIYGRYLIPFAPLLLLAISGLITSSRFPRTALTTVALTGAMLINIFSLHLIWDTYHRHTSTIPNQLRMALHFNFADGPGTARLRYENMVVRRPGDSVEDGKIYLVRGGERHWIINGSWLGANGYAWPDDVNIIPPADLAAIPEGAPIQ